MFFIRQNEVFIFFTRQYPHNKSRITPTPPNISLTIYREMPNRARELKQRNTTFNPLPLCSYKEYRGNARRARGLEYNDSNKIKYQSSPPAVPSSIAGRYKTIGRKGYFSTLLPCVLRSKILGRWHAVTVGLNQTIKKFLCYLFNPSSPELRSFGLSPIPLRDTGEKVE